MPSIRASFSPPVGSLNGAAKPRFNWADEPVRDMQQATVESH